MKVLNIIDVLLYKTLLSKFYIPAEIEYEFIAPEEDCVIRGLKTFSPDVVLLQENYHSVRRSDLLSFIRKATGANASTPAYIILDSGPLERTPAETGSIPLSPDVRYARRETLSIVLEDLKREKEAGLLAIHKWVDGPARQKAILFVDPSKTLHRVVKSALSFRNYKLISAYDGEHARALCETREVDLILTSVELPGVSGLELCRWFKEERGGGYLPVIVVSSSDDPLDVDTAFNFGADDYLYKSFTTKMLQEKVAEHLAALDRKRRNKVLVVDDSKVIRELLRHCFMKNGLNVLTAEDGSAGLQIIKAERPDVVVTDIEMPGLTGYELCEELRRLPDMRDSFVVMMSSRNRPCDIKRGERLGVSRYFVKPFDQEKMLLVVEQLLAENFRRHKKESEYILASMKALVTALEARDLYTKGHTARVSAMALELGRFMELDEDALLELEIAANLHDIGKIGVRDSVLLKPDKLTDEEYAKIQEHAITGAEILRPIESLKNVIPLILYHHERWDGEGYPSAIRGESIPLGARIIAIADAFDAMTSNRPYRRNLTAEEALNIIRTEAGAQFCPLCAASFLRLMESPRAETLNAVDMGV
jgi:putative two-component system response regulator